MEIKMKTKLPDPDHQAKMTRKNDAEIPHWRPITAEDRDALIRLGGEGGITYDDDAQVWLTP